MPKPRLVLLDPGHFHAALVQKEMYETLSPEAHVYAPLGPELLDYLGHIARFNTAAEKATAWQLSIEASADFLKRLAQEPAGGVAVIAGRNGVKIERIEAAVEAGLHVLADKPMIIRQEDLPRLDTVLGRAAERGLVVHDLMTGRIDEIGRVIRALRNDPEVFGEPVPGNVDEPGVRLSNVHQLLKTVAGVPNRRPPWYFDITEQGEGLADTGTHLVDRVHETLFPGEALDYRHDIRLHSASRWATRLSLAQFQEVTGAAGWPDFLAPRLESDTLEYFCNGRLHYDVRGIYVALECRWEWQTEAGDDTHNAIYRGSRARIELRQGKAENYRAQLYVVPEAEIAAALEGRIAALQSELPGIGLERRDAEWRIVVPNALRRGHDANFAAFTRRFLRYVEDPNSAPACFRPNLLAKYYGTTGGVALSRG
ncbi:MAG: oxidoreductase [Alphaproteobacteria bacterium]|nr:oxidoreductase [Alphaproteobacteria bacterium]MBV9586575.1 oxidoreductase [Alphaproteobacteria bacterium]MBV9967982.1 oxidoreductase [Alphaproteobacteria bacterium]